MTTFVVDAVPAYADDVIDEYAKLSQACCYGYSILCDALEREEPKLDHRCGLIGGRFEVYAIPIPECSARHMIISIDRKDPDMPRCVHGTVPNSDKVCDTGSHMAMRQLGYAHGPREL
jgi:hypothetical protein